MFELCYGGRSKPGRITETSVPRCTQLYGLLSQSRYTAATGKWINFYTGKKLTDFINVIGWPCFFVVGEGLDFVQPFSFWLCSRNANLVCSNRQASGNFSAHYLA